MCIINPTSFAQLKRGFDPQEVKEMIALCNSYSYLELYNDDRAIIPKGYTKIYSSPVIGMDNKFQVYTKGNIGVVNFRGSTAEKFGQSVNKQIERELGNIELPQPKNEINYSQICNIIMLPPPDYPLELKDSSLLNDSVFLAAHPRDHNGVFQDKSVYKKTPMSLNHKPYNYYTSVLKLYFPKDYEKVEPKLF
jgi:hypothetical protein